MNSILQDKFIKLFQLNRPQKKAISNLPLEDRKDARWKKISMFKVGDNKLWDNCGTVQMEVEEQNTVPAGVERTNLASHTLV